MYIMSENITRKAQTGEPTTNGGHFGSAPVRAEADLELDDGVVTVQYTGTFEIDNGAQDELPAYPESLPAPNVSLNWDNGPETIITVGDKSITFWNRENETHNNIGYRYSRSELVTAFGGEEVLDDFTEWGDAVHKRVDDNVYSATLAVVSGEVEAAILAMAQGNRPAVSE